MISSFPAHSPSPLPPEAALHDLYPPPRVGVIFLGRKRPGFDQAWGEQMEARVRTRLSLLDFPVYEPSAKAVDDVSLRAAVEACRDHGAAALLLVQATMADARLAPTLAQLWPDPPILWATPENPQGDMISSCSLVGAHCWASVLRQMGHRFELVYGDPDHAPTAAQLSAAIRLAATVRRLRSVRIGLIGAQAPGYFAMHADPFTVHRGVGAQIQEFSLLEFADAVNKIGEAEIAEDVNRTKKLGLSHKDTSDADLPMASRLYLAMRGFLQEQALDVMAIRCWPELPNTFGQWPYLGIARLTDEGWAVACEGDADGALTAWIGASLGMGRCYLTDWLEHDHETITLWHGGAAPMRLCQPRGTPGEPRLALHFNIKKPMVVEATLRADMPVTLLRFWRCDGQYFFTAREGQSLPPRRHLMGTNALVQLADENPQAWFEELCNQGMPHHIVLFAGHHASQLRQLARLLPLRFI